MPCAELDESRIRSDALTLRLGRCGEILGTDEVRGGHLLPGDLAWWLGEWCEGLTCETADRLLGCGLVAILEEELSDHVGIDGEWKITRTSRLFVEEQFL